MCETRSGDGGSAEQHLVLFVEVRIQLDILSEVLHYDHKRRRIESRGGCDGKNHIKWQQQHF